MVDKQGLRAQLFAAIDTVLDSANIAEDTKPVTSGVSLRKLGESGAWTYRWPAGSEIYTHTSIYEATGLNETHVLRVAWGSRDAWNRAGRGRVVVFGKRPGAENEYPYIEFTEADDGRWAAAVYPTASRRQLRQSEPPPDLPINGELVPVGEVFAGVKGGNTVRLVVDSSNEEAMAIYGLSVARTRGRT